MSRGQIDIHQQIHDLLAAGEKVYSVAAGRVGEVVACDPHPSGFDVTICPKSRSWRPVEKHNHTHGATTFRSGDAVHVEKRAKGYYIVNTVLKGKL